MMIVTKFPMFLLRSSHSGRKFIEGRAPLASFDGWRGRSTAGRWTRVNSPGGSENCTPEITSASHLGEWDDQRYDRRKTTRDDPPLRSEKPQALARVVRNDLVSGGGARKFRRDRRGWRAILHAWRATSPEGR